MHYVFVKGDAVMRARVTNETIKKITLIGLLTALATVFSYIKIPIVSSVTVTLVLPIVVIGAALFGPLVGAWLTVIPAINAFSEAGLFLVYSPFGCILTLLIKGIAAGFAAGIIYKVLCKKHPKAAVNCAAVAAPIVNSGIFLLGCYVFIWEQIMVEAANADIGIGMLIFFMVGMNFVIELILNIILCPTILRIIKIAGKKKDKF